MARWICLNDALRDYNAAEAAPTIVIDDIFFVGAALAAL